MIRREWEGLWPQCGEGLEPGSLAAFFFFFALVSVAEAGGSSLPVDGAVAEASVPAVAPAPDELGVVAELERSLSASVACVSPWLFCWAASPAADEDPAPDDGLGG